MTTHISAISECTRCPRMARARIQVVPWKKPKTHPRVRVMFIGEAPGKMEDAKGRPFQGPSAKGFDALRRALGLRSDEIYVTNAVKCFAPQWNAGSKEGWQEIQECRSAWLLNEIMEYKPFMIIALGTTAMKSLLDDKDLKLNLARNANEWPRVVRVKGSLVELTLDERLSSIDTHWLAPFWHPSPANHWRFPQHQDALKRHPLILRYKRLIDAARSN